MGGSMAIPSKQQPVLPQIPRRQRRLHGRHRLEHDGVQLGRQIRRSSNPSRQSKTLISLNFYQFPPFFPSLILLLLPLAVPYAG